MGVLSEEEEGGWGGGEQELGGFPWGEGVEFVVKIRELGAQSTASFSLKTLTSLNKEVRPFFLGDNSIWSFPSVSSLSDYSISRS